MMKLKVHQHAAIKVSATSGFHRLQGFLILVIKRRVSKSRHVHFAVSTSDPECESWRMDSFCVHASLIHEKNARHNAQDWFKK